MRFLTPRGAIYIWIVIFCGGILVYLLGGDESSGRQDQDTSVQGTKKDGFNGGGLYDYLVSILRTSRPEWSSETEVHPTNLVDDGTPLDTLPLLPPEYSKYYPNLQLPESLTTSKSSRLLALALHAFLSRPVLSHSEYMSPDNAEWTEKCPIRLSEQTAVEQQFRDNGAWWHDVVDKNTIRQKRVDMVEHLKHLVENGQDVVGRVEGGGKKKKRGLVLTGGNSVSELLSSLSDASREGAVIYLPPPGIIFFRTPLLVSSLSCEFFERSTSVLFQQKSSCSLRKLPITKKEKR
jgi:hypothetical protein